MRIREKLTLILSYDWVSVPLVYTQLVTLAVYSYFLAALFGAQWVQPDNNQSYTLLYSISVGTTVRWTVQLCFVMVRRYTHSRDVTTFQGARLDLFYPIFLTLQFAFFVGWLKV